MIRGGRFGKYGDIKRKKCLREARLRKKVSKKPVQKLPKAKKR